MSVHVLMAWFVVFSCMCDLLMLPLVTAKFLLIFVCCSYNKTEGDFASLREYNDYLEEVETISESKKHCYPTPIS